MALPIQDRSVTLHITYEQAQELKDCMRFVMAHDEDCDPEFIAYLKKHVDNQMKKARKKERKT